MLFGRAFEKALAGYFRREDAASLFFKEWTASRNAELTFSGHDTWDSMLYQGFQLLDRFAQEDRIRIPKPRLNQQIRFSQSIGSNNDFIAYFDAICQLDVTSYLLEWKTTFSNYPEAH